VVGAGRSGAYLLFTFLGGATFFFGPILGAILMVLAFVLFSELTNAWLLYLGLIFLVTVMYAPGGIASLIMMNLRVAAFGRLRELWVSYLALAITALVALAGAGAMIEMVYHLQLNSAGGSACGSSACRWTPQRQQLVRRRLRAVHRRGHVRAHPARLPAALGRDPGVHREGNQAARGPGMSTGTEFALELRDLRKSFGKTEIIRGANLQARPANASPSSAPTAPASRRCST
jgi:hypothetical protein